MTEAKFIDHAIRFCSFSALKYKPTFSFVVVQITGNAIVVSCLCGRSFMNKVDKFFHNIISIESVVKQPECQLRRIWQAIYCQVFAMARVDFWKYCKAISGPRQRNGCQNRIAEMYIAAVTRTSQSHFQAESLRRPKHRVMDNDGTMCQSFSRKDIIFDHVWLPNADNPRFVKWRKYHVFPFGSKFLKTKRHMDGVVVQHMKQSFVGRNI